MQDLQGLTEADFRERVKEPVSKLEVFIDPDWVDICNLDGKNYLISATYSNGQREQTYKPIAAEFSAEIDNEDGSFHPKNEASSYKDYFKVGRKIRFKTGFKKNSTDYLWQWFIGVISKVSRKNNSRTIQISGFDFMQYLSDVKVKSINNYWGTSTTKSTIESQATYSLPSECNGVYMAYLDGSPIYDEKHWVYNRSNNKFVFLPDYVPTENGTDNLLIYYFTDQSPEDVVADLLVMPGLYADRASALSAMDYVATGETIKRVWFSAGLKILTAIQKMCERVDYRFFYKYDGTPVFRPIESAAPWDQRVFTFAKDLLRDQDPFESTDEVKNHIVIEGEPYSDHDRVYKILSGADLLDETIKDRHIKEFVVDLPYETQEVVYEHRDVIVPFYIPSTVLDIKYVYLNIYFPGLQDGDYPYNTDTFYLPHFYSTCKTIRAKNGTVDSGFWVPHRLAGNGKDGTNYFWYRWFFKFDVVNLRGFKLNTCTLKWALDDIVKGGSGGNTQIPMVLHGLDDYGMLLTGDWNMATDQDFGVVQNHDDTPAQEYSKDIKTWAQSQLDVDVKNLCFRMKGQTEHTDTQNANQYYTSNHQLYVVLEEDTSASVSIYADNGSGFGGSLGSYNADQEDIDLTNQFSGSGKKQLKFTCSKTRRIDILIRVGLSLSKVS